MNFKFYKKPYKMLKKSPRILKTNPKKRTPKQTFRITLKIAPQN
jgi:hypothetical protein